MSTIDRAEIECELYQIRCRCGALHQTLAVHGHLLESTLCAAARDNLSDAIATFAGKPDPIMEKAAPRIPYADA